MAQLRCYTILLFCQCVTPNLSSDDVVSIQGIPIVSASIENKTLNIFQKLPAYYTLETGSTRTSKGGEIDEILGVKMIADFDLKKLLEENKTQ